MRHASNERHRSKHSSLEHGRISLGVFGWKILRSKNLDHEIRGSGE
jgi:hypothetical protein